MNEEFEEPDDQTLHRQGFVSDAIPQQGLKADIVFCEVRNFGVHCDDFTHPRRAGHYPEITSKGFKLLQYLEL
jgi:hypothetical protein